MGAVSHTDHLHSKHMWPQGAENPILLSRLLFTQLNAQLDCSRKMLKLTLKFTLKCSYMFRFNNHHQGAYCCALLKL